MNNSIENESSSSLTEPYISFLNSANPMPVKIGQDAHTPTNQVVVNLVPPCDTSLNAFPLQDMHRQEEEYRKSVTIIFWYQVNDNNTDWCFDVDKNLLGKYLTGQASPYDTQFSLLPALQTDCLGARAWFDIEHLSGYI